MFYPVNCVCAVACSWSYKITSESAMIFTLPFTCCGVSSGWFVAAIDQRYISFPERAAGKKFHTFDGCLRACLLRSGLNCAPLAPVFAYAAQCCSAALDESTSIRCIFPRCPGGARCKKSASRTEGGAGGTGTKCGGGESGQRDFTCEYFKMDMLIVFPSFDNRGLVYRRMEMVAPRYD